MALSPSARAASLYSCAGTNTDVCDPAGTDVCTPTPGGLWDCFTAVAGETLGPPGATTYTVYDAAGAISGTADSYVTYGVESLGNAFCCSVASGGVNDIFVHSGLDGDTLSLQDTALGLELQEGSLGILQARASGGDGNDDIFGSDYAGAAYSEDLSGNNNVDYIEAHAGDDDISLGNSVDECDAGDGADLVDGGLGFDKIEAGTGDDTVVGGDGSDTVNGDAGLDDINGGLARDFLSGDDDADIVWGGALNDAMCGDASSGGFADVDLDGGTGNDTIWGDDAADAGTGGAGTNICGGGAPFITLCASYFYTRPTTCP